MLGQPLHLFHGIAHAAPLHGDLWPSFGATAPRGVRALVRIDSIDDHAVALSSDDTSEEAVDDSLTSRSGRRSILWCNRRRPDADRLNKPPGRASQKAACGSRVRPVGITTGR
jgi:hypothetical protein